MNLSNLEIELVKKLKNLTNSLDILTYSKAIERAKVGAVNVVRYFDELPELAETEPGSLWLVETEYTVYIPNKELNVWRPIVDNIVSLVYSWGSGSDGQLGNNSYKSQSAPVTISSRFADWCQISAGQYHNLALKEDSSLWSWGVNFVGNVGDGTTYDTSSPVNVVGKFPFEDWCAFSAGYRHTLALRSNGEVWGWGGNFYAQLGLGFENSDNFPYGSISSPIRLQPSTKWCKICANGYSSMAQDREGNLWAWGCNRNGELGVLTTDYVLTPTKVVGGFTDWTDFSLGFNFTLGLRENGTIWSWGRQIQGRLGDNQTLNGKSSPATIVGGITDWCQINAGSSHSAAIRLNGSLWTWGNNATGQLGDGTTICRSSPVSVIGGFTDWCKFSVYYNSLALRSNGTIWAWGQNSLGRVGDGTTVNRSSPVSIVGGFTDWCNVVSGNSSTLAIRSNCTLWSWGNNTTGQLGDGTTICRSSPVSVIGGFTDWCKISSKGNPIAQRSNGTLWVWGSNRYGRLGDGTVINKSSPVSLPGALVDWCQASAGCYISAAVRRNGTLWTWGWNQVGSLGDGTTVCRSSPVSVLGGFTDWCYVDAGKDAVVGLRSNKTLWTFGANSSGTLGTGNVVASSSPVSVINFSNEWSHISLGNTFNVAIRKSGSIWSWGEASRGQLGNNCDYFQQLPVLVTSNKNWTISTGVSHTLALDGDSILWAWGYNFQGKLGDGTEDNRSSPVTVVGGFTDWCQINAGYCSSIAVRCNGTLWAWGSNCGGLGDGTVIHRASPVSVVGGFTDWCQASTGAWSSAGVRTNGTLWAWGVNYGILGDGTTINRSSPVSVIGGFTDWCSISIGGFSDTFLAKRQNNTIWSWGGNNNGQQGDGTTIRRSSPVSVLGGFTDWCQAVASCDFSVGLRSNGTIWTWGNNSRGQLGDNNFEFRSSPVSVVGGFTDWCQVSAGSAGAGAIRTNGSMWVWGDNELGDGTNIQRSSPVTVLNTINQYWKSVSADRHVLGIIEDGSLWAWGFSGYGRIGDGVCVNRSSPVAVCGGFTDWCQASAGYTHSAAVRSNGTLWTWGIGVDGQLGNNLTGAVVSPVSVAGGFTDWCQVSAGAFHTSAMRTNGTLWAWGGGFCGQVGDGTTINRSSPVSVSVFTNWCQASAGGRHTLGLRTVTCLLKD